MQHNYKTQPATRPSIPERHIELRIGEGLLVLFLFAMLMLVLF